MGYLSSKIKPRHVLIEHLTINRKKQIPKRVTKYFRPGKSLTIILTRFNELLSERIHQ